jgi:hypothetical protein
MTTYVQFKASNIVAPQYHITLDNDTYLLVVTWNLSSQRFYINIYATGGVWICTVPLIETEIGNNITSMNYDDLQRVMVVTIDSDLHRPPGQIVRFTIENCQPNSVNGTYYCLMLNSNTFTFPLPIDPGKISILGSATRLSNMIEGFFQTSSLVYRSSMFEIRP